MYVYICFAYFVDLHNIEITRYNLKVISCVPILQQAANFKIGIYIYIINLEIVSNICNEYIVIAVSYSLPIITDEVSNW